MLFAAASIRAARTCPTTEQPGSTAAFADPSSTRPSTLSFGIPEIPRWADRLLRIHFAVLPVNVGLNINVEFGLGTSSTVFVVLGWCVTAYGLLQVTAQGQGA